MRGRKTRRAAAWRDPDTLTDMQACAALGIKPPRLRELLAHGLLQRYWRNGTGYVRGVEKLRAWRSANVAGF